MQPLAGIYVAHIYVAHIYVTYIYVAHIYAWGLVKRRSIYFDNVEAGIGASPFTGTRLKVLPN